MVNARSPAWPARVKIGSIAFEATNIEDAVSALLRSADERRPLAFRFLNAYCVALADQDPSYAAALQSGGYNFPDGAPVAWLMRRRGASDAEQIRGPSFFSRALEEHARRSDRVFLLGGSEDTLTRLRAAIMSNHPGINVVGVYSPPFAPVTNEFIQGCVDAVRPTKADVLWIGLGTPKQDLVGGPIAQALGIPYAGVGAAFDFLAGTVPQPPRWIRGTGLEWVFRLLREPRRLWRRYLFGNARFIRVAMKER